MSVCISFKFQRLNESNSFRISEFFVSFILCGCHWPDKSCDIANSFKCREGNVQIGTYNHLVCDF